MTASEIIAGIAILIAAYSAALSTRAFRRERTRDAQQARSDIRVLCGERAGLGGQTLVIGETVAIEHVLMVRVINDGEAPEYVHSITLESEAPSPLRVAVKEPVGTVEVRPRDQALFEYALDGSQGFQWEAPFRVAVRLANERMFYSEYGTLSKAPSHGTEQVIPDPDQVPDSQVGTIRVDPVTGEATAEPPQE